MTALPTTTTAFGSGATEAQFKSFLADQRDFLAGLLGTDGLPATARAALGANSFPSGTAMLFVQASAPTGWTKSTIHNDKALRIVSGTGGVSGGSVAFSTVFGRTASDASSLSIAQLAAHTHPLPVNLGGPGSGKYLPDNSNNTTNTAATGSTGSGSTHSHGMDLRVTYVDAIIATKD